MPPRYQRGSYTRNQNQDNQQQQQQQQPQQQSYQSKYEGRGNPYNELLYLKKTYENTDNAGTQSWASNRAKRYYSMLDEQDANKLHNMDYASAKNYIDQLRSQERMTAPVNPDQYRSESATLDDLMEKYGFDYSREYAKRQAEAAAQAKRDAVAEGRQSVNQGVSNATESLDADYFQQYMNQAQKQVAGGINAGIASDQNLRLQMANNAELADVYRDANNRRYQLDNASGRIEQERIAQEEALYNERLQQAFDQIMGINNLNRSYDLAGLQAALQQRGQNIDMGQFEQSMNERQRQYDQSLAERKRQFDSESDWREYAYAHMSATDKARLEQNASQFGENMAWQMYELEQSLASQEAYNQDMLDYYNGLNFNSGGEGSDYANRWKTAQQASKSPSYKDFVKHMNAAVSSGGVPAGWVTDLTELIGRESSWNPNADNPSSTAYGYGQFLDSTEKAYEQKTGLNYDNPVNQIIMMAQYVKDRYGTPAKALQFWDKKHWY